MSRKFNQTKKNTVDYVPTMPTETSEVDSLKVVETTAPISVFRNLTREQFILVELLKAGVDTTAVAAIAHSTNEEENQIKSTVAPILSVAAKRSVESTLLPAVAKTVEETLTTVSETTQLETFVKLAVDMRIPLNEVTLADLV